MGQVVNTPGARTEEDLRQALRAVVARLGDLPVDQVRDDAPLGELGVDSLGKLELVATAESVSGVKIPDSDAYDLHTVDDVVAQVRQGRGWP